jgi:hypothetical protein
VPNAILDRPQTSSPFLSPPSSQLALGDAPTLNPPKPQTISNQYGGSFEEGGASSSGARSSRMPYYGGLGRGPVQNAPRIPRSRSREGNVYDSMFVPNSDFGNAPRKYSSKGETFKTTTAQKQKKGRREMLSSPPNPMFHNLERDRKEKWY